MINFKDLLDGVSGEGRIWLLSLVMLSIGPPVLASAIAWPCCWYAVSVEKAAMENGYEQRRERTNESPIWVKVK